MPTHPRGAQEWLPPPALNTMTVPNVEFSLLTSLKLQALEATKVFSSSEMSPARRPRRVRTPARLCTLITLWGFALLMARSNDLIADAVSPARLLKTFVEQQQQHREGLIKTKWDGNYCSGPASLSPRSALRARNGMISASTCASSVKKRVERPIRIVEWRAFIGGGDGGGLTDVWGVSNGNRGLSRQVSCLASDMGLSGLGGMAAGYAAKRFGRLLSFACGFVLVSMKVAEELGYVAVDWEKIEGDARRIGGSVWGDNGVVRRRARRLTRSWQVELGPNAGIAGSFLTGFVYAFNVI